MRSFLFMPKRKIVQCECAELQRALDELSARYARACGQQVKQIQSLQENLEVSKANTSCIAQAHAIRDKLQSASINSLKSHLETKEREIQDLQCQLQAVKNRTDPQASVRDLRKALDQPGTENQNADIYHSEHGRKDLPTVSRLLVDRRDYAKFVLTFDSIEPAEGLYIVKHLRRSLQEAEGALYESPPIENTPKILTDISVATSTDFTELVEIRIDSELANALITCDNQLLTKLLLDRLAKNCVNALDLIETSRVLVQVRREPREISDRLIKSHLPIGEDVRNVLKNRSQFIDSPAIREEIRSIKGPIEQVVLYFFERLDAKEIPLTEKIRALTQCHQGKYFIREDLLVTLKQKLADIRK